jgi:hypothetical protein
MVNRCIICNTVFKTSKLLQNHNDTNHKEYYDAYINNVSQHNNINTNTELDIDIELYFKHTRSCKGANATIKNRVKCRTHSDTYYIRHREAVLEKRRAARSAVSEASSVCNVYSVMESSSNPVVSFD